MYRLNLIESKIDGKNNITWNLPNFLILFAKFYENYKQIQKHLDCRMSFCNCPSILYENDIFLPGSTHFFYFFFTPPNQKSWDFGDTYIAR